MKFIEFNICPLFITSCLVSNVYGQKDSISSLESREKFSSPYEISKVDNNDSIVLPDKALKYSTSFSNNNFTNQANFNNIKFADTTIFSHCTFDNDANFTRVKFGKYISFFQTHFAGELDFENVTFGQFGEFSDMDLGETNKISFNGCRLPDTISFGYNPHIPNIDFSITVGREPVHRIFLFMTDISKLHLDYIHFKLYFYNYRGFKISDDECESVYEQLLKNFKDHGQNESFRLLDLEYQDFRKDKSGLKIISGIPRWWWNYGYNKEWVFKHTAMFLAIFTFVNYFLLGFLNKEVYKLKGIQVPKIFNLGWRLWYSFVYTASIFFRLTLKLDEIEFRNIIGTVYLLLIYSSGIICLAYMANFVLQK